MSRDACRIQFSWVSIMTKRTYKEEEELLEYVVRDWPDRRW